MKKIILFFAIFQIASIAFATQQYSSSVYWNQRDESNTLWNFELSPASYSYYDAFGIYNLSDGLSSAVKLSTGDNILKVTENLGFWASAGNRVYDSMASGRFSNNPFFYADSYTVGISEGRFSFSNSYIHISAVPSPSGQPLPGALAALLVGGAGAGAFAIRRKKPVAA